MVARRRNTRGGYIMGMVLEFRHARSSIPSRDAKLASLSAVSPAVRARSVESTSFHQRSGMRLRCHHLETCEAVVPVSLAQSSRVGQSSIIARNEANLDMTDCL